MISRLPTILALALPLLGMSHAAAIAPASDLPLAGSEDYRTRAGRRWQPQ